MQARGYAELAGIAHNRALDVLRRCVGRESLS
jgi:hypothetical protein